MKAKTRILEFAHPKMNRQIEASYGRALEDFQVGDIIRHWPGRTVTQADNALFCGLTMNQHPLHLDAHYSGHTSFGKCVVNGVLVFAIGVGLSSGDISGAAIAHLEYENVVHLLPVFPEDTLYARSQVLSVQASKSKTDRGVVQVETRVSNQREEDVLVFGSKLLIPRRKFALRPHTHSYAGESQAPS